MFKKPGESDEKSNNFSLNSGFKLNKNNKD